MLGCANHPTVQHFELAGGQARPVFRGGKLTDENLQFARKLSEVTLRFVRANIGLAQEFQDEDTTRLMLGAMFDRFALAPDRELVQPLRQLNAAADQNLLDARPLIAPLSLGDALRMALPGRFRGECETDRYWLEGSLAISEGAVRAAANLKRQAKDFLKRKV